MKWNYVYVTLKLLHFSKIKSLTQLKNINKNLFFFSLTENRNKLKCECEISFIQRNIFLIWTKNIKKVH